MKKDNSKRLLTALVVLLVSLTVAVGMAAADDITPNRVTGYVEWSVNSTPATGIGVNVTCNLITATPVTQSTPPSMVGRFDTLNVEGWNTGDAYTITIPGYVIDSGTTSGTLTGENTNVGTLSISANPPPEVTVNYPNGGEEIVVGTFVEVSASVTDDSGVENVTFYYSNNNGTTWNLIGVVDTPTSGSTTDGVWNKTWNTTGLCDFVSTECLIKAAATDGTVVSEDQSDSTFSLVDRTKPIVINPSANPATIAINTGFTELRVDIADTCGNISNVTINLSAIGWEPGQEMDPPITVTTMFNVGNYTSGDGLLWTTYNYTTNASIAGTFYLTVNATDEHGNYNDSVSIMLNVTEFEGFPIDLAEGLNLVSIPLIPETLNNLPVWNITNGSVDTVANPIINCSPMDYNITTIWRYNATAGSFGASLDYQGVFGDFDYWYSSDPTFKGIEPDKGYFFTVKSGGAFTWVVVGSAPVASRAVDLAEGLNLVGMTTMDETRGLLPVWNITNGSVDTVANPIINCSPMDYNITTIWRYNATTGSFGASLDYQGVFGDFDYWYSADEGFKGIEPGRGYFFTVKPGGAFTWEYEP